MKPNMSNNVLCLEMWIHLKVWNHYPNINGGPLGSSDVPLFTVYLRVVCVLDSSYRSGDARTAFVRKTLRLSRTDSFISADSKKPGFGWLLQMRRGSSIQVPTCPNQRPLIMWVTRPWRGIRPGTLYSTRTVNHDFLWKREFKPTKEEFGTSNSDLSYL